MNNEPTPMPRIILGVILAGILALIAYLAITHSFIELTLQPGVDKTEITNSLTGRIVSTRTTSGWIFIPTGDYIITSYQAGQVANIGYTHVGPLTFQSRTPQVTTIAQKPLTFLNHAADLVTPLGKGYIYLDKNNRTVNYADTTGTTNISSRFELSTDPNASLSVSTQSVFDTVINIEPTAGGGVVVTTTRGVFTASGPNNVTRLPLFSGASLNYTSSAYDRQTNCLFVISTYSGTVYRFELNRPTKPPVVFYQARLELNRLAAGGGKVVAYYDAVPSTEPAVLAQYALKRQLNPLVLDASTGKLIKELTGFQPATYISLSDTGNYMAIKKKLSGSITIYDLAKNKTAAIPSYDTSGADWRDDTFYIGRDSAIWSYNANDDSAGLAKVAATGTPVTRLLLTTDNIILTTNQDTTAILGDLNATKPTIVIPPAPAIPERPQFIYYAAPQETKE